MIRRAIALFAALVALTLAATARADLFEWPTCIPPDGDTAKCAQGGFPNEMTTGPDGGVWFVVPGGQVDRADPVTGAITVYPMPPSPTGARRVPTSIDVGADGTLWYADELADVIGHVTTAGAFSEISLPGTFPTDVILGPDGRMWVASSKLNSIGRIEPGGTVTWFALPAATGFVHTAHMAVGPDKRIWWCGEGSDRVGAITTSGTVTQWKLPKGGGCGDIVRGPDGAMWATGFSVDSVFRITTSGAITQYVLAGSGPTSIATGPDGALWIGEGRHSGIVRMTTAGAATETPLVSGAVVNGIATGPDGAIWFSEAAAARIGRLTLGSSPGPEVLSIDPTVGPTAGGTSVTIEGRRLSAATRVMFGVQPAASFTVASATRIVAVTAPGFPGPVDVQVAVGGRTTPIAGGAVFTFSDAPAALAAPAPTLPVAAPVRLGSADATSTTLVVPVVAQAAGAFVASVALTAPRTAAAASGVRRRVVRVRRALRIGRVRGSFAAPGSRRVRIHLKRPARRGSSIHVAVRLTDRRGAVTVAQRTYRIG